MYPFSPLKIIQQHRYYLFLLFLCFSFFAFSIHTQAKKTKHLGHLRHRRHLKHLRHRRHLKHLRHRRHLKHLRHRRHLKHLRHRRRACRSATDRPAMKFKWQWGRCSLCHKKLYQMRTQEVNHLLRYAQKHFSHIQRLELFSEMFLGGRYRYGPLGEGRRGRYDRDPLFRLDKVDCLTYIETVMALAMSYSKKNAKDNLQKIRYKNGKIAYRYRNHFTATQWLVENSKHNHYLKEITQEVGRGYVRVYHQKVRRAFWRYSRWGRRIPRRLRPKSYSIRYIPLKYIHLVQKNLPNFAWMGEIFDKPEHPSSIRHVGFLHKKNNVAYFRHANIGKRGVRDEDLRSYTRWRQRYYTTSKKSPYHVLGYIFWKFL